MQELFGMGEPQVIIDVTVRSKDDAVLKEVQNLRRDIMAKFEELKASVEQYIAGVEAWAATANADVQKLIDAAIAADDAGEEVDYGALKDEVDAAFAKVPKAPDVSNVA